MSKIEELLGRKSSSSGLEYRDYGHGDLLGLQAVVTRLVWLAHGPVPLILLFYLFVCRKNVYKKMFYV
jgi:hypothetical protein